MNWTYSYTPEIGQNFDWQAITEAYIWVQNLQNVAQDPIYHAEGDVYIHTRMVLEELIKLKEWQNLNETNRSILFVAALMHDIAKPLCTEEVNGRIVSPRHALVGSRVAGAKMFRGDLGEIPFEIRVQIIDLVRYHGLPLWILERENPEKLILKVSQSLNLKHLALLAEADVRGRICEDQNDLLERIDLFRALAQEQNCYENAFDFENDLCRFTYFQKEESSPLYVPFDDLKNEVILLAGLPGTGKNTWVAEHGKGYGQVCLDDIRRALNISPKGNQGIVIQTAKEQAKVFLRKQQPFIWNATNLQASRRKPLVDLFTAYKARVKIVYIEANYSTLLERNRTRDHPIPPKVLERFINGLEIPKLHEAHFVEYFIG